MRTSKKLVRMINKAWLKANCTKPVYKYGFQVPIKHVKEVKIDEKYRNSKWVDAEKLEIQQLMDYEAFKD